MIQVTLKPTRTNTEITLATNVPSAGKLLIIIQYAVLKTPLIGILMNFLESKH